MRALQSLRLSGKLLVNQGQIELRYVETKKRPGEIRTEATLQGMTAIQGFDGKEGWRVSPFQGRKDPERMSADEVSEAMRQQQIATFAEVAWGIVEANGKISFIKKAD